MPSLNSPFVIGWMILIGCYISLLICDEAKLMYRFLIIIKKKLQTVYRQKQSVNRRIDNIENTFFRIIATDAHNLTVIKNEFSNFVACIEMTISPDNKKLIFDGEELDIKEFLQRFIDKSNIKEKIRYSNIDRDAAKVMIENVSDSLKIN
jgi:hypothetical protein